VAHWSRRCGIPANGDLVSPRSGKSPAQHAACQREQKERDRRVATLLATPDSDQEKQRNQREFEKHVKQDQVAGREDPQAPEFQQQ